MTPTALRDLPVSRRCALLGVGGVGAAAVLAACSSGSDGGSGTTTSASGTPTAGTSAATSAPATPATSAGSSAGSSAAPAADAIASLSDIPVGGTATAQVDGETVLLSQPTAGEVDAFSATCPHQGATVQPDGGKFKCPLHGSEFALDGSVTEGPAQSGLTTFAVTVSGDSVVKA